jgi:signal transduction histidine kinase
MANWRLSYRPPFEGVNESPEALIPTSNRALRRLAQAVLETPDADELALALTRDLPEVLACQGAVLLIWDRKLDSFHVLDPGETRLRAIRPEAAATSAPAARYLLADGQLIETQGQGQGVLVPLQGRTGLVGMLVLGERRGRRPRPLRSSEARGVSEVAARAALALENHLYQRELLASERMAILGTMTGMLAHDFRGPMTIIRGYAETLLDELPHDEVRSRAELIVQAVDRLERMTAETLDYARGSGRLSRRQLPATLLLRELAEGVRQELPGLEVEEDVRLPPGSKVCVDPDKLRRVISNLASNARDAMGGKGRLHLRLEAGRAVLAGRGAERDTLDLLVSDEGPGVPEDIRDRVFEPFVTKGKKSGTGLGLAVARRFVEDHGGVIELLPSAEPPGARFRIRLPVDGGDAA